MSKLKLSAMLVGAAAALGATHTPNYSLYGDRPVYRQRTSYTKPFVTTAEMRKQKKAERQRKRDARRKQR